MKTHDFYLNQTIVLATCHGKERALRRPFCLGLGASITVCACDTDQLGSFSGEIARSGDALTTAHAKARLGLEASGHCIALASEGSFGPHPAIPLMAVGQELLLLLDQRHGLAVAEQRLEWQTNYSHVVTDRLPSLDSWLHRVAFPSHALIVRSWTMPLRVVRPQTSMDRSAWTPTCAPTSIPRGCDRFGGWGLPSFDGYGHCALTVACLGGA